jgi:hypothetical protein
MSFWKRKKKLSEQGLSAGDAGQVQKAKKSGKRSPPVAGIATRLGRPLPGQDSHLLDLRTFARHTWSATPGSSQYRD